MAAKRNRHDAARPGKSDVERLMKDKGIVRSHAKVRAAISNARAYLDLKSRGEDFSTLVWALLGGKPIQAAADYSISKTTESERITKALKARAHNIEALMATFTDDALVNDVSREFWGSDKIRPWLEREITGAKVTMDVVEVIEHHGDIIVRAEIDGEFDKTGLPDPLVLIDNGKISQLIITNNKAAP